MRTPVHARFVNRDYGIFQQFYRANSSKFQKKRLIKEIPSSSGTEKVVYEYLETSDGYLVYRDGVTMRVASPAEVHANTALLESSMSLYQELHGGTGHAGTPIDSLPKARKVAHFQSDRSASIQPPSMQPLTRFPVQPPNSSTYPIHDSGSPQSPDPQTVEDAIVHGTLDIIPGDDHTPGDEQLFYQECCQFIHDFGGGTEEGAQRIKPLAYGALIHSGKGINWPPPENPEAESGEDEDARFGRLQINFSELTPSGTEKGTATDNKQILKSRFAAARHELKKHELFLRTPAISSEQLQKNMVRKEMHAIKQYIRKHYSEEENITDFLWDHFNLPETLAYQSITYLLSGDYGDSHTMSAQALQAACDLSKALKKKAHEDNLQPPYRPRYTARQMRNPGLSERRGISLFERLKERAGPGGIWDSPYTLEDVEAFRRYYYSRLPSVEKRSDVGNQAYEHFHKTLRNPDG